MRRRCACLDNLRTGAANFVLLIPYPLTQKPSTVIPSAARDLLLTSLELRRGLRASLASLLLQAFASDAHALLLVRIRWTQRAHIRRDLPHLTFVRARNHHVRLFFDRDRDAFRNRKFDRMRITQRQRYVLAFHFRTVANAHNVQILLESSWYAGHRSRHQRPRQSVQRALVFRIPLRHQRSVFLFEADPSRYWHVHLAFRSLHFYGVRLDLNLYAGRHWNNLVSNSRHSSTRPRT